MAKKIVINAKPEDLQRSWPLPGLTPRELRSMMIEHVAWKPLVMKDKLRVDEDLTFWIRVVTHDEAAEFLGITPKSLKKVKLPLDSKPLYVGGQKLYPLIKLEMLRAEKLFYSGIEAEKAEEEEPRRKAKVSGQLARRRLL